MPPQGPGYFLDKPLQWEIIYRALELWRVQSGPLPPDVVDARDWCRILAAESRRKLAERNHETGSDLPGKPGKPGRPATGVTVTAMEAAELLGMSAQAVRKAAREFRLPGELQGDCWRFERSAVEEFGRDRRVDA